MTHSESISLPICLVFCQCIVHQLLICSASQSSRRQSLDQFEKRTTCSKHPHNPALHHHHVQHTHILYIYIYIICAFRVTLDESLFVCLLFGMAVDPPMVVFLNGCFGGSLVAVEGFVSQRTSIWMAQTGCKHHCVLLLDIFTPGSRRQLRNRQIGWCENGRLGLGVSKKALWLLCW